MTNRRFFVELFGDSSYVVPYLRWHRLPAQAGRADRLQLRLGAEHENPYLCARRQRNGRRQRAAFVNADYSSTSFRLSMTRIGREQLPRQRHRLPAAGPDGRQLPAGHEGAGPDRRAGPGGRRAARLARLRDPAHRRARQPVHPDGQRRRAAPAGGQEPAQPRHDGLLAAGEVGLHLRPHPARPAAADLYAAVRRARRSRRRALAVVFTLFYVVLVERASTGFRGVQPTYCSIYQSGFWRSERFFKLQAGPAERGLHRHPVPVVVLAAGGRPAGPAALRRRLRHVGEEPGHDRRRRHAQRRLPSSSATRRRTTRSSPTASRSVPAARSASARSSTTA